MNRGLPLRSAALLFLLGSFLSADVVVLKNGDKIRGKVVDKGLHYEVTTESGLRTFLAEEVEDVITDPKELLGDAEAQYEQAKADYQKALAAAPDDQRALFKEIVAKVGKVRGTYATAVELFPEDGALSKKLVEILQFLRLCRDRVGSEFARQRQGGPAVVNPPAGVTAVEAAEAMANPERRADPSRRAAMLEFFRALRTENPGVEDVASAAVLFLSRTDSEWRLGRSGLQVLQDYFARPWLKQLTGLTPVQHLEASAFLTDQVAAAKKADPAAGVEPAVLFALGHLGHAAPGPEREKTGRALGLVPLNGILGTAEGHAVRDLDDLIDQGDYLAAMYAFTKEYRNATGTAVRYAGAYAQLLFAQRTKGGYDGSLATLGSIPASDAAVRDHVAALVKSIRDAAPCLACGGEGKLRCTNCHGVKETRFACQRCKGKGRLVPPGLVITKPKQLRKAGSTCAACKGTGVEKVLRCEKCKDGYVDCKKCDKARPVPELSDLFASATCPHCEGKGLLFKNVVWTCPGCLGLGQKLAPKADPTKLLP
jgi:tetratricopeptide (TPR) repeat protein